MAIDFPNSPATNATYTVGNKTWIYDGTTWNTYNTTSFSAETLPGTTIKSTVTGSSLTSVGTLGSLAVTGATTSGSFVQGTDYLSPYQGFRNAIINGDMRVDQRNSASTAVTTNNYVTDRWRNESGCDAVLSAQQSTDVPTGQGFAKSLKITSTTADTSIGANQYAVITQHIEGNDFAHLAFGSASAKQIVVSFWVKATVTGTYSFTVHNNGASRLLPTAFTISASNTWEKKTVVIAGDTSGTWLTDTGRGVSVNFYTALGSSYLGTSGVWNGSSIYGVTGQANAWASVNNVFAVTGVQVERGSVATPFEQRPIQTELALCQRYYYRAKATDLYTWYAFGMADSTTAASFLMPLPVTMRVKPHTLDNSAAIRMTDLQAAYTIFVLSMSTDRNNAHQVALACTATGLTTYRPLTLESNNSANSYIGFSAEL